MSSKHGSLRVQYTFSNAPNTLLELCKWKQTVTLHQNTSVLLIGNGWKSQSSEKNISWKELLYLWLAELSSQGRSAKYLWGRQFGLKCITLLDIRNIRTTESFLFCITFFSKPCFLINPFCSTFSPTDKEMSLITSPLGYSSRCSSQVVQLINITKQSSEHHVPDCTETEVCCFHFSQNCISCSIKDIQIFKSCRSYMDKTWQLGVYNRTAGISLLKLLSHENKEQKLR